MLARKGSSRTALLQLSVRCGPQWQRRSKSVFSGVQATGLPHLGNYLGAIRQWVDLLRREGGSATTMYFSVMGKEAVLPPGSLPEPR
jgi:tryptophanyl-tRNA synthetase